MQPGRIPTRELIETFFTDVQRSCGFLTLEYGLSRSEGLRALTAQGEEDVPRGALPDNRFLLAQVVYGSPALEVEFAFDNFEFHLDVRVTRHASQSAVRVTHELWLWLEALEEPALADSGWLTAPERLQAEIERAARLLARCLLRIRLAGEADLAAIEATRREQIAAERDGWAARDHERTAALAAEAFRARDFSRVVSLLEEIEWRLMPSERRKLEYARARR